MPFIQGPLLTRSGREGPTERSALCPWCRGASVELAVWEHPECGAIGYRTDDEDEETVVCEKCATELDPDRDLLMLGTLCRCVDCERRFDAESPTGCDPAVRSVAEL